MSLLEDVFLQDEANEAEELERVIEGDEFEERRRSDSDENSEKEDEAEEDKRRVDPTKAKTSRVVKNPRLTLNPARLTGPRGIQVIPDHFKDFKFKGKGHEKEDLDLVLKRLEHWAYRLYPKFQFEDCLKKIEMLGKKRPVAVHLHKIRSDQFLSEDTVVQKDSSDEDTPMPVQEEDEFDKLLQQQIELARSTPAPSSAKKSHNNGSISPQYKGTTSVMMPKATSSPSINDEQRERMLRSRKLAEERRLARLKNAAVTANDELSNSSVVINKEIHSIEPNIDDGEANVVHSNGLSVETDVIGVGKKHNRSNIIDSSDEEDVVEKTVSVAVDIHNGTNKNIDNNDRENNKATYDINSDNIHFDSKELSGKVNEELTEENENIVCVSNSDFNEGNKSAAISKENEVQIDDMSLVNDVNADRINVNALNNMSEDSDDNQPLTYDDSDVNIEIHDHNTSNEIVANTMDSNNLDEEETAIANDMEKIDKGLVEDVNNSEGIDVYIKKADRASDVMIQNEKEKECDQSKMVAEELIEDAMDIDFSEDF